jgi:VWFA-related protein
MKMWRGEKLKKGTFIIGILFLILFTAGQEIQEEAIAINIEVPVRVYDGNKFVENLTIEDFELYEDAVLQKIDAVYLIKERTIKRKESVEKEELVKEENIEKKFAPKEPRHFFIVFELLDYTPQIKGIADYFFQNIIQPEDTLQIMTPVKTYRLKAESFKKKTKEEMGKALWSIVKKDVGIGNSEYRNLMEDMKKNVRAIGLFLGAPGANILDAFADSLYTSHSIQDLKFLISAYEINLSRLEQIRGIEQKKLINFGTSLKEIEGQKIVFLLYQREHIPQVDHKALPQITDLMQTDPAMYMALENITGLYARGSSLDVEKIRQAYADASISAHFMFLTKSAEIIPGITMQESSSDIFSAFKSLADATGGRIESSASPEHLFEKAVEASENYYLLYYTPKNYVADGKFKKIEVKVKGKKYKVTHRAGYIAD